MSYRCVFGWDVLVKMLYADPEAVAREAALGRGGRRVPMRRVAVLGTGIMGAGMARSLLRSGLDVIVWNRSRGRAAPLAADGAQVAGTAAGAVAGADAVVTMLWDGGSVAEVMTAALPAAPEGVLWAQTSTVSLHDAGVRLPALASRYGARAAGARAPAGSPGHTDPHAKAGRSRPGVRGKPPPEHPVAASRRARSSARTRRRASHPGRRTGRRSARSPRALSPAAARQAH